MSEYSPGQFEITLHHRDDALRAVDEAVMFKRVLRGVAQKHGSSPVSWPSRSPRAPAVACTCT